MWPLTLFNICLLRANPQDLPTSGALTAVMMLLYYAADLATALTRVPLERAWLAAAANMLLLTALTILALKWRQQSARLQQTLMALFGCGVLLGAVMTVVGSVVPAGALSWYVALPALLWLLAVYGHILRHALEVPYMIGIAATGAYLFLSFIVVGPLLTPAAIGG